jgi:threonine/homoserine/homoserine lactone efflux protein
VSGLGVALADATYAAVAAFGLTAVTSILVGGRAVLGLVGGLVIVWLAYRTMTSRPTAPAATGNAVTRPGLAAALVSIYGLTMTNPMTILSFTAVFAALGLAANGALEAATLTLGVFIGSGLWWIMLTTATGWLRSRVTLGGLLWVNRLSGGALLLFGVAAMAGAIVGG